MYSQISLNNCISIKKISYLKGTISIGHDCIILIFDFEGFMITIEDYCLKIIILDKKNGLSFFKE